MTNYTLSNFEIRCDVIHGRLLASIQLEIRHDVIQGRLLASLPVTLKCTNFAAIPHITHTFYGNSPQIRNDITSNLEVGQSVLKVMPGCHFGSEVKGQTMLYIFCSRSNFPEWYAYKK